MSGDNEMVDRLTALVEEMRSEEKTSKHIARAAIAAMREPSKEMVEAADAIAHYGTYGWYTGSAEDHWRAMIDAILQGDRG